MPPPTTPPPLTDGVSSVTSDHDTTLGSPGTTVQELISSISDAFQNTCIPMVESILTRMEEEKMKKMDSIKERIETERLKRLSAEEELKACRIECSKLREGRDELRRENCKLKCAKLKAESEIDLYMKRFEELEARVLGLEKDLELLSGDGGANWGEGVLGKLGFDRNEMGFEGLVGSVESRDLLVSDGNRKTDNAGIKEVRTETLKGRVESVVKLVVDLTEYNEVSHHLEADGARNHSSSQGAAGTDTPALKDDVEIPDSDDETSTQECENRVLKRKWSSCEYVGDNNGNVKTAKLQKPKKHGSDDSPFAAMCSESTNAGQESHADQISGRLGSLAAEKKSHIRHLLEKLESLDASDTGSDDSFC